MNEHQAGVWHVGKPVQHPANIPALNRKPARKRHAGVNMPVLEAMFPADIERQGIAGDKMQGFKAAPAEAFGRPES